MNCPGATLSGSLLPPVTTLASNPTGVPITVAPFSLLVNVLLSCAWLLITTSMPAPAGAFFNADIGKAREDPVLLTIRLLPAAALPSVVSWAEVSAALVV